MAIPDYQSIMLPLLKLASDKEEHSMQEALESLASSFKISEAELQQLLPSGQQRIFDNRVGWARTYLKKAGLLDSPKRGVFIITEKGLVVLKSNPPKINVAFLRQYPEFVEFQTAKKDSKEIEDGEVSLQQTPEESLEYGYQKLRQTLAQDLLGKIKSCSAIFFEKLVVELLVKMGYGGSRRDAGQAIGKSGDEGIDGIIKEDKLGLDVIYIQAKKWEGTVGRPEIMKFVGALQGQHARKGIFITTSYFTEDAMQYAKKVDSKIILIDGDELSKLMIDHDIGVAQIASYDIKRIDSDYFSEE
jgi:restriction system protein